MKIKDDIWLSDPEEHDFPAAFDYLTLHFDEETAGQLVTQLEEAKTIVKKAKDILRASDLKLAGKNNIHVKSNIKKVKKGKKISPVLLVRTGEKLIIADGYHRCCSIYYLSEDLEIPCRIVTIKQAPCGGTIH